VVAAVEVVAGEIAVSELALPVPVVGVVVAGMVPPAAFALPVVVVLADGGAGVVVVTDGVAGWDGATSLAALQICAYEACTAGGGSSVLSGWPTWNRQPSTSSAGLETECSAGPSLA
jgi:hypothetical protein